jgi:hypothetical protein
LRGERVIKGASTRVMQQCSSEDNKQLYARKLVHE